MVIIVINILLPIIRFVCEVKCVMLNILTEKMNLKKNKNKKQMIFKWHMNISVSKQFHILDAIDRVHFSYLKLLV